MNEWLAERRNLSRRKEMITFDLVLPYVVREFARRDAMDGSMDEDGKPHKEASFQREPALVTDFLIRQALQAKYGAKPDDKASGVKGTERKINGRILNLIGAAIDGFEVLPPYKRGVEDVPQPASVKISREALDHLKSALDDWRSCATDFQGYLEMLQERVEDLLAADKREESSSKNGGAEKALEKAKA